jgi:DNA end-binding protein Ku
MPATVWKGFISFGLVSFPVRLLSAARGETVHFHMLHKKDLSRVKEVWFCVKENKRLERADIVKGYETSKGAYVILEDEDLKAIAPPTATTMDVVQFVGRDEVDPVFFERSYYVAPEKTAAKSYGLFAAALAETEQHAIARLTLHNREHVVLMRPTDGGLVLHTLYYQDELHRANKAKPVKTKYGSKELTLAKQLVNHLAAPFKPEQFTDTYRDRVQQLVDEKRKGVKVTAVKHPRPAHVVDLVEALKKSIASASPGKTRRRKVA